MGDFIKSTHILAHSNRASKYMKRKCNSIIRNRHICNYNQILQCFSFFFICIKRHKKPINVLLDICRTLQLTLQHFPFFSSTYKMLTKMDHIIDHNTNLNKFQNIQVLPTMFSDKVRD